MSDHLVVKGRRTKRYDLFLSHNSRDKPVVERIAEKLARAGLGPWLDKWCLTPGGRWQEELAEGLAASSACAVFIGPADVGAWEREELAVALDRAVKDPFFRLFLVLLPGLPEPFDPSTLSPFLSTRTWVDFRRGPEDTRAVQALVNATKGIPLGPEVPIEPREGVPPYRGLQAFDEEHAEFFFGRDADVQRLLEKLKGTSFLGVLGPSGSGKSSLARAGLVPALRRGALPGSEDWAIVAFRPGAHPLDALTGHLLSLYSEFAATDVRDQLVADPRTLRLLSSRPPANSKRVLFLVDQCEEVFTLCRDEEERRLFLLNLLHAAAAVGPSTVVLTLRADFYPRCAAYPEFAQQLTAQQFLVGPMGEAGLRQAIEEPARLVGLELEAGLVDTILDDVEHQPGALPLLEHALLELWERRRGRMLTLEAYRESGGVEGALAKRADAILASFGPRKREIVRRVLLRLTQPGEGAEDTRRRAPMRELVTRSSEVEVVEATVRALTDARLLTSGSDEDAGERLIEVSHEALIRGWPQLRRWVEEDRQGLRIHRRLTEAAEDWQSLGRDPGALYRGGRLLAAREWAEEHEAELNDLEREFLETSYTAETDELEAAKKRTRRLRALAFALAILLLVAALLAFFAVTSARNAEREREKAEEQQSIALSRALASDALARLDPALDQAILLSLEALDAYPTAAARDAAIRAVQRSDGLDAILAASDISVFTAALSPDARVLASAGSESYSITLWDVAARRRLGAPLQGHENEIFGLAFSADGKTLASASDDETIRLWDVLRQRPIGAPLQGELPMAFSREGIVAYIDLYSIVLWDVSARRELTRIRSPERASEGRAPNAIAFSPDGRTLAEAGSEGLVSLWNLGAKAAVGRCLGERSLDHGAPVASVALSPDGHTLVSAGEDGKLRYWRVGGCRPQGKAVQAHTRGISSVVFSLQGDLVASTGSGQVRLWDARTHAEVGKARDSHEDVSSLAFSPDGRTLTAVGIPGTIKVWDVSGGKALEASSSGGAASDLAISPDGRFVALVRGDPAVYPPVPGGTIEIWDATTRTRLGAQIPPSPYAAHVAFNPDSRILASSGFMFDPDRARETPQIRLWDVATRKPLGEAVRTGTVDPSPIAFAQGGKLLASASKAAIALWEVPTLRRLRTIRGKLDHVISIASSPDGKMLAWAGSPPMIELRDLDQPERVRGTLDAGGVDEVVDIAFSPDGKTLAAVRSDGTIRLWDVRTLHPRAGLAGARFEGPRIAFSRDGRTLGYLDEEGIRFWDVASETALGEPLTSQSSTNAILFSPIDDVLVSAGENPPLVWWDGVLWSDELGAFKRQLCPIVRRSLTQEEWAKFLPGEPYHRTCG
jgi:WD40 repeat protein